MASGSGREQRHSDVELMERSASSLLTDDSPSLFREGFYSPCPSLAHPQQPGVPWSSVREVMSMARDALKAKQRAAERLARELEALQQAGGNDKLLARAQRAEVDSGSLLDELQQLIQAKADVAQQRADLDRANALLRAERQLLCEQLQVSPDNVNLCQAVSKVLAAAKRARQLDGQLRLLAKFQRELLLQLEAQREEAGRAARQWQAREQAYLQLLASHGIPVPQLPGGAPEAAAAAAQDAGAAPAADSAVASASSSSSGGSGASCSNAALLTQLMLVRMASGSAAEGMDVPVGSPAHTAHSMLPPTPPVHDMLQPPAAALGASSPVVIRRSHSLDSGINSLTGLLDQLALGQLGPSDDSADYGPFDECERDSSDNGWLHADAMSADGEPRGAPAAAAGAGNGGGQELEGKAAAAGAVAFAAAASAACKGPDQVLLHHHQQLQQQQHLQTVQELPEDVAVA